MERNDPPPLAPRALGHGLALASVSLAMQLLWPLASTRDAGFDPFLLTEGAGYVTGAVLRLPVSVALGAVLAYFFGARGELGKVRPALVLATFFPLLVDATAYRWLGETGDLLRLGSTFSPERALTGMRGLRSAAMAVLATAAVSWLSPRLELRLVKRCELRANVLADALSIALTCVVAFAAATLAPRPLATGASPTWLALGMRPYPAPAPAEADADAAETDEPGAEEGIPREVQAILQHFLAPDRGEASEDPTVPFCRRAAPTRNPDPRAITMLVLRGVTSADLRGDAPNLPRIAALAREGALFENVIAGGDDPTQGLVQLLTGVVPLAPTRYDELGLPPRLPSVARALSQTGLETAFITTHDLSPGRERNLVQGLGFGRVSEPTYAEEAADGRVSGDDAATLAAVTAHLERAGAKKTFVVAPLSALVISGGEPRAAKLSRLDGQVAAFVAAARARDPRGLVVLVGDSPDQATVADAELPGSPGPAFEVPLILLGLDERALVVARERKVLLAGLHDVPSTLLGLAGQGPVGCFHGRDLLSTRDAPPEDRRVVALAGASQHVMFVHEGRFRWRIDTRAIQGAFALYDRASDPTSSRDLFRDDDPATASMRDFAAAYLGVGRYLASRDRYVPGASSLVVSPRSAPSQAVELVNVAATNLEAASRGAPRGARLLLQVGFDAQLTPVVDGVPLTDILRRAARLRGVRLALLVGMLDSPAPLRSVDATRRVVLAVDSANLADPPLLLPRDPIMATSLAARTPYEVFVTIPGNTLELVDTAQAFGADGVVVPAGAPTPVILRARSEGMQIVLEGVENPSTLGEGERPMPDYYVRAAPAPQN